MHLFPAPFADSRLFQLCHCQQRSTRAVDVLILLAGVGASKAAASPPGVSQLHPSGERRTARLTAGVPGVTTCSSSACGAASSTRKRDEMTFHVMRPARRPSAGLCLPLVIVLMRLCLGLDLRRCVQ